MDKLENHGICETLSNCFSYTSTDQISLQHTHCVKVVHKTCSTDNQWEEKNCLKRHGLDKSCISVYIMGSLCSCCITDTRRPTAAFVGKTLTGSVKTVKPLCPAVTSIFTRQKAWINIDPGGSNIWKDAIWTFKTTKRLWWHFARHLHLQSIFF